MGLTQCTAMAGMPPVSINVCYDLQSSAENCGSCGNRCPMGQNCVSGGCM
jgi:hypothetical protein